MNTGSRQAIHSCKDPISSGASIESAPIAPEENSMEGPDLVSDTDSLASSVVASSIASTTHPDKYGFLGGAQYTVDGKEAVSADVIRKREVKWMDMIKNWDEFMEKHHKKVRARCRKGIPSSMRGRAWLYLCGAQNKKSENKGVFDQIADAPGDPKMEDEIRKDIHRQFPQHEMFLEKGGTGQEDLYRVLKVHSSITRDGYCQAHAPVAATLLMQMPAEDAFWCLKAICEEYVAGYYDRDMEAIQIDGEILQKLLKRVSSSPYKKLKKQKIEPILYMTEWFMCLFCRTLPWTSVLRVWDMFFFEGIKVMFRVGLVLLKYGLRSEILKNCSTYCDTLEALRNIDQIIMQERFLLYQMERIDLREEDLKRAHSKQLQKRAAKLAKLSQNGNKKGR